MPREIVVAWAGVRPGRKRDGYEALCAEYRRRIAGFAPVRDLPVKAAGGEGRERLRAEAAALRRALPEPSFLVALDRAGEALSSEELAARLGRVREEWPHAVVFAIGSDLGLDADFVAGARWRLSLGRLTLPHALARLVLYEQVYRALTLRAGMSYHRRPL